MPPVTRPNSATAEHTTGELRALPPPEPRPDDAAPTAQDFKDIKEGVASALKIWRWLSPGMRIGVLGGGGLGLVTLLLVAWGEVQELRGTPDKVDALTARVEYIEQLVEALAEHEGLLLPPKKKAKETPDAE